MAAATAGFGILVCDEHHPAAGATAGFVVHAGLAPGGRLAGVGAIDVLMSHLAGDESLAAVRTRFFHPLKILVRQCANFAVLCQSFRRSVPCFGERADACQPRDKLITPPAPRFMPLANVFTRRQAFQILKAVVLTIAVFVVDVPAVRDGAVVVHPDLPVQIAFALPVGRAAEILAVGAAA